MKLEEVSLQVNVELEMVGNGSIKKSLQNVVGNRVGKEKFFLKKRRKG